MPKSPEDKIFCPCGAEFLRKQMKVEVIGNDKWIACPRCGIIKDEYREGVDDVNKK